MQSKQHTPGRLRCIQLLNGERREQESRKSYRQYPSCSNLFAVLFMTTHHAVSQAFECVKDEHGQVGVVYLHE